MSRQIIKKLLPPILTRAMRRVLRKPERSAAPPAVRVERFVFSEESSSLSEQEYTSALGWIERLKAVLRYRDSIVPAGVEDRLVLPGANWDPKKVQHFEFDGDATNISNSAQLVLSGDFEILRKLRLYSQAFTGYQLATLALNAERPWIRERLPEKLDDLLRLIASAPDAWSREVPEILSRLPEKLRVSPPHKFGEIGWMVEGRIINYDLYAYLVELCLMHENKALEGLGRAAQDQPRVLEIGGGYGGLAYYLMKIFGNLRYTIVDLPESLLFSSVYLSTLFPDLANELIDDPRRQHELAKNPGFSFIPNFLLDRLSPAAGRFDLVINTLSMAEMTREQVVDYCRRLRGLMKPGALFFEHNNPRLEGKVDLDDLIRQNFSPRSTLCRSVILKDNEFQGRPRIARGRARIWRRD